MIDVGLGGDKMRMDGDREWEDEGGGRDGKGKVTRFQLMVSTRFGKATGSNMDKNCLYHTIQGHWPYVD